MTFVSDQMPGVLEKSMRWVTRVFLFIVIFGVAGFGLWTWASLAYVYSKGERAGYVQKFSQKGWLFKTWEGELAMVNLPGAMPEIFDFSVRGDETANKVRAVLGQRVVLTYDEHRGIPTNIFAETSYFVTDVHVVDAPAPGAPPVSVNQK